MSLLGKIWGFFFPFEGMKDGLYYKKRVLFTGTRVTPTGRELNAIRDPHGCEREFTRTTYEKGGVVEQETFWEYIP